MKKPIVVLTGPTAVGKTELSIQLAKAIGGEIISADSMQVYNYLVDELEPFDEFHVVKFQEYAKKYLNEIYAHGKIPIIAGGTGFYIQALLNDIDFTEQESDSAYRKELEALAEEHGNQYLHDRLKEVDPESAEAIHPNNRKRVIRALEFFQETGGKISEHNAKEQMRTSPYNFAYFVLNDERSHLYKRIDARVDKMIEDGLEAEVRRLKEMGCTKDMVAMQGIGYKEMLSYLDGSYSLEEAVYIIKRETRHFAKRQITWFKRERDVIWLNKNEFDYKNEAILAYMIKILKEKAIIS